MSLLRLKEMEKQSGKGSRVERPTVLRKIRDSFQINLHGESSRVWIITSLAFTTGFDSKNIDLPYTRPNPLQSTFCMACIA